ncbi:MAG: M24 family metallopeptidase [Halobacteriales archaeon]|nr:M24 family metallopeptidase [Halobacteriales archaeon]
MRKAADRARPPSGRPPVRRAAPGRDPDRADPRLGRRRRPPTAIGAVAEELGLRGGHLVDDTLGRFNWADAVGWPWRGLATETRSRLYEASPEGPSFEPVAASGPNGAMPHHRHGDRVIGAGDPVVLDFGAWVAGYAGDQTRTVVFGGEPPGEFVEAHEVVSEALEAGIAMVEPGVEAQAVDRAARALIEDAGHGDAFIHRTGHGVGLEVHEAPYIVEGNDTTLEPGMVFSVEPGVYREGAWGVRVEDLVAVTDDGAERLNGSPRGWRPL